LQAPDYIFQATADGSISLLEPSLQELYHNRQGAYTEALMNYAAPTLALLALPSAKVRSFSLLDSCFGLGYNSLTCFDSLLSLKKEGSAAYIKGFSIKALDIDYKLCRTSLPLVLRQPCFKQIAGLEWLTAESFQPGIRFDQSDDALHFQSTFIECDLRQYLRNEQEDTFDVIYHDPFSPRKVTELWTLEVFAAYKQRLQPNGSILTYSAASAIRGALRQLGFHVYRTAAVGGKSGGTLACLQDLQDYLPKLADVIMPLSEEEERRLRTTSGLPYRDPELSLTGEAIRIARLKEQGQIKDG